MRKILIQNHPKVLLVQTQRNFFKLTVKFAFVLIIMTLTKFYIVTTAIQVFI